MNTEEIKDYLKQIDNASRLLPDYYKINSLVDATGGQGVVYRGDVYGQDCAIKLYYPDNDFEEARHQREIEGMKKIHSDYVVRLVTHEAIPFEGTEILVTATEFVNGETLNSRVDNSRLTLTEIHQLWHDVAHAIIALWEYEIVHRDLKPSNIMVRADNGKYCVIDLGCARHIGKSTLTVIKGATYGSHGYMSHEQRRGEHDLTCKSDVFALAVILAQCAIGQHPTSGDQRRMQEMGWLVNLPPDFRQWKHYGLFEQMLYVEPSERPHPKTILEQLGEL